MRPTRDQGILVESTLEGQTTEMTIDATAMQHIMAVLTDLYSDPARAVLREYATNAIDSHVEAGVTDPIEVSLPTPLSPFLRIKDNGVGLTGEDIEAMYSKYGASTKRGTNEQTGMLGLGSKSALTYAQQFTIVGRKDGWKISVAVSRSDQGGGIMTVVNRMKTSEPNGVEIVIPANRETDDWEERAESLFKYWPEGTVLVNGKPVESVCEKALKITDNIWLVEEYDPYSYNARRRSRYSRYTSYAEDTDDQHTLVMGNVPYPMTLPNGVLPSGTKMVAFVPIGSVNFTPSREALHYTNHTKKALEKVVEDYRAAVNNAVQQAIDAADSHSAALAVVAKWGKYLNKGTIVTFRYKKDELPSRYEQHFPDGRLDKNGKPKLLSLRVTSKGDHYGRLSGYTNQESVSATEWPSTIWVEDFKPADCSADHKRKLDRWLADSGIDASSITQYVLLEEKLKRNKFIADTHVVSYPDSIRPIVLKDHKPINSWGEVRIPESYRAWTENSYERYIGDQLSGKDIRQGHPIIYVQGGKYGGRNYAVQLKQIYTTFTLLAIPANRIAKFKRIVPKALTFAEAVAAKRDEWAKKLTQDQRLALAIHDASATQNLAALDPKLIDDPDLTEAIRLANVKVDKLIEQRRVFGEHKTLAVEWTNPLDKYPLILCGPHYRPTVTITKANKHHVYLYLNCAYKDAKKGTQ